MPSWPCTSILPPAKTRAETKFISSDLGSEPLRLPAQGGRSGPGPRIAAPRHARLRKGAPDAEESESTAGTPGWLVVSHEGETPVHHEGRSPLRRGPELARLRGRHD